MRYKLNKEEFEALSEDMQKEYKLEGDIATLTLEGDDLPTQESFEKSESKRKLEAKFRKEAETKLQDAENRAAKLQDDLKNAGGDTDAIKRIQQEHAKEIEGLRKERALEIDKAKADRNSALVREESEKFANQHFITPDLITDKVAKRLSVEEVDGHPVVRVLTADGKPSTAAIGDLHKEFLDNESYKPIIKANVGSGGSAPPNKGGSAPVTKKLSDMTATEEAAFANENPEAYAAALDSH